MRTRRMARLWGLVALCAGLAFETLAKDVEVCVGGDVPPVVAALRKNAGKPHPRLFGVPSDVDLRLRRSIVRDAERHFGQPPVERKFDESGRRLLQQADKIRRRVVALASASRLTGERMYAAAAERELLAAADWTDWNPAHWLDVTVMLEAMSIGCDWLWDAFPAATREKLAHACLEKGLKTVRALPHNVFWRKGNTNWTTSCWYGTMLASIVFHECDPELTEGLMAEALSALPRPVEFLAPEGCYPEGPSYWGSVVGYLYAIDALESALGSDFGLASVKGLRETAFYRARLDGPSGYLFNYSDAGWGTPYMKREFAPPALWFAKRFGYHDQAVRDREEIERRLAEADRTGAVVRATRTLTVEDALEGVKAGERVTWRLFTDAKTNVTADGVVLEKEGRMRRLTIAAVPAGVSRERIAPAVGLAARRHHGGRLFARAACRRHRAHHGDARRRGLRKMKPELKFPVVAHHRIIVCAEGKDIPATRALFSDFDLVEPLAETRASAGGKYASLGLSVRFRNKDEMARFDERLKLVPALKMVL